MKKIAIVLLNWNGAKLLEQFLPTVILFSNEAQIYVVDNASTDESIAVLKANFPTVKIIQNKQNYGYAEGYNQAMQQVEEEYYGLVNSDIEVTQNWLAPILSIFENQPEIGIIQPKILDFKNKDYFEYAGAAGGFIDKYGFPFCRGRIFDTIEKDLYQYEDEKEIFWASGACFFIRKEIYRTLKGFDDDFFAHQEEIDLCWRAFNLGYKIKYTSQSVVYHVGGATLSKSNPHKTFLNFRNSLYMLVKNLPQKQLLQTLFTRMCLDGIAGIRFLLQGEIKLMLTILQAHYCLYRDFLKFYKKRGSKQKKNYFHTKSIVWNYFVKKEKTFR